MQDDRQDKLPFGAEHAFLTDFIGASVLATALRSGVVDALAAGPRSAEDLAAMTGRDGQGIRLLLDLLTRSGVVEKTAQGGGLSPAFARVLSERRGLLEARLGFLEIAAADVGGDLDALLFDLPAFIERSRTFGLFRYDKALDVTPAAIAATRDWVAYVTALSEAEVPELLPALDLSGCRRMIEIGGNTGVLSEALVARYPGLSAAIIDLPAVCALGEERMRARLHAGRVRFVPGDAFTRPWPGPVDAVVFKSVLHDWPDDRMQQLLTRAVRHLTPGGRIVICERGPVSEAEGPLPFWMLANLVFAPFYRNPLEYEHLLKRLGLTCLPLRHVKLDLPFQVVNARLSTVPFSTE